MKSLSDGYLLTVAQIAATLIGLLVVGMYYYLETGLRHLIHTREMVEPVIRAMSKTMFLLFSLTLGLSLALVSMTPGWTRALFVVLGVYLLISMLQLTSRTAQHNRLFRGRAFSWLHLSMWLWTGAILGLPWILGGMNPSREEYGWSVFLAGMFGFMNAIGLLLSGFDIRQQDEEFGSLSGGADDG